MEKLELFAEALNDFRSAFENAQKETREYKKTSDYVYKPQQARFKAVIYRKDGEARYYYSYDNKTYNKERLVDEYEGLLKLLRLIHKYKGQYKNAIIYTTLEKDKPTTANYNYQVAFFDFFGNSKENNAVNFVTKGRDNLLNLDFLKQYGKQIINK